MNLEMGMQSTWKRRTLLHLLLILLSFTHIPGGRAQDDDTTTTTTTTTSPNTTTTEPFFNTTPQAPPPPPPGHLNPISITDLKGIEGKLKEMFDLREFNESCEVVMEAKNRPLLDNGTETFMWYQDPCDKPRFRRFMHCNVTTNRCECYKYWLSETKTPAYEDPEAFKDVLMWDDWMEYNHHAKECLVLPKKKCGVRSSGEITPYRCLKGLCSEVDEEDENKFVCSKAVPTPKLQYAFVLVFWAFILTGFF